jgi:hypothetical protein
MDSRKPSDTLSIMRKGSLPLNQARCLQQRTVDI